MFWIASRELVSRRTASLLAGLGLLSATLGFVVLASTSQTTEAVLTGDIGRAWNTPYDILVRPPGHQAPLETLQGLIRPNFLGSASGGITMQQLAAIRGVSGVDVAAPVAVAGYMTWPAAEQVLLGAYAQGSSFVAFRVTATRTGDAGMTTYPPEISYILAAAQGQLVIDSQPVGPSTERLMVGNRSVFCTSEPDHLLRINCQGQYGPCPTPNCASAGANAISTFASLPQAVVVAGVDPQAEARLAGLDRCVSSGRYLSNTDSWTQVSAPNGFGSEKQIPVLVSDHTFIDESLTLKVDRATEPAIAATGDPFGQVSGWTPVVSSSWSADDLYRHYLDVVPKPIVSLSSTWTPGDVTYVGSGDQLRAQTTAPDYSVFQTSVNPLLTGEQLAPPEAKDVWFRQLTAHPISASYNASQGQPAFLPVGHYDPACLAGFNPLAGGALETYAPASVTLPDGHKLAPNASVTGYVNMPPTILTTLSGISVLDDPSHYAGAPGAALISVIRVRVAGTQQPGPAAQERLSRVASEIHDATGLQVDIVKGASPRQIRVDLPPGNFGRPALTVTEPWSVKGVGFRFLQAVSLQNLLMFSLVLLAATILVGETAYISVRRRKREFGVLRALGWPSARIAWLVELEMLMLGLVVGVIALLLGIPLALGLGVRTSTWQLFLVMPLAIFVAALATILPAMSAGRGTTMSVIGGTGSTRRSHPPASAMAVGMRELLTHRHGEAAMGVAALALGATLVGEVALISAGFRGQLDATLLGTYLTGQVRPFHFVIAVLTLAIGAIAAGEVVTLGYLERRTELGTLRAVGWPRQEVLKLLLAQAFALGLVGGVGAALLVVVTGVILSARATAIEVGVIAALAMALLGIAVAVIVPITHAFSASPADALRGE
jgi:putative ABC transport system permease protein